jgi:hypothetical protein
MKTLLFTPDCRAAGRHRQLGNSADPVDRPMNGEVGFMIPSLVPACPGPLSGFEPEVEEAL